MGFLHTNHPPVPATAHLGATNFEHFRHRAGVAQMVVKHHLPAGARDAVRLTRRQTNENRREDRVTSHGDRFDIDDGAKFTLDH